MKQMTCPNCNGGSFREEYRFFVCEFCGGRFMKEESERIPVQSRVSPLGNVDSLLRRADLYWDFGERSLARNLYRQVLDIDASIIRARERAR